MMNGAEPLDNHRAVIHRNGKAPKEAEPKVNGRGKARKGSLQLPPHIKVLDSPVAYQCTLCDKTFSTRAHVHYHRYCGSGKYKNCMEMSLRGRVLQPSPTSARCAAKSSG